MMNIGALNNRFLGKTNPQYVRAIADSGSVLNSGEINLLARQMVDMGIWGDLKLWGHSGLAKTRTSGSDLFLPKVYDISGNNNDAVQTTEANQPKLVALGMEFDGSDDDMTTPAYDIGSDPITVMFWFNGNGEWISLGTIITNRNSLILPRFWVSKLISSGDQRFVARSIDSKGVGNILTFPTSGSLSNTDWHYVCVVRNGSTLSAYLNDNSVVNDTSGDNTITSGEDWRIMQRGSVYTKGIINDIRIFSTALTEAQTTAIFNATKSKYGL